MSTADDKTDPLAASVRSLFEASADGTRFESSLDAKMSDVVDRFLRATTVSTEIDFDALCQQFTSSTIPIAPRDVESYIEHLSADVVRHSINTASPQYIGHMTSALPYFVRPLGRLLTGLNQNLVKIETAKALTPYEREALAMMHRALYARDDAFYETHIQKRESTLGIMTSGGTLANMTALWIARNTALGPRDGFEGVEREGLAAALRHRDCKRAVVVGSALLHYSVEKAADVLGLGTQGLVRVPVDTSGRVIVAELERVIAECKRAGTMVLALVGIAGTTDSGAIDPLPEMAAIAKREGVHFHVDAAWGGPLVLSDRYKHRLAGLDLADSVTIDGHKQLYLPMGIGMVVLRDPIAAAAIEKQAQYIIRADSPDLGKRALEGSRPGMALFLHAALHVLGRSGYAFLIEEGIRKTEHMANLLETWPDFELLVQPQMNILNYRYVPTSFRDAIAARTITSDDNAAINAFNVRLQEAQRHAGQTFVSRTSLRFTRYGADPPITALRAIMANPLTTEADIHAVLQDQLEIGRKLEA